jgi:hypothetical protein
LKLLSLLGLDEGRCCSRVSPAMHSAVVANRWALLRSGRIRRRVFGLRPPRLQEHEQTHGREFTSRWLSRIIAKSGDAPLPMVNCQISALVAASLMRTNVMSRSRQRLPRELRGRYRQGAARSGAPRWLAARHLTQHTAVGLRTATGANAAEACTRWGEMRYAFLAQGGRCQSTD